MNTPETTTRELPGTYSTKKSLDAKLTELRTKYPNRRYESRAISGSTKTRIVWVGSPKNYTP